MSQRKKDHFYHLAKEQNYKARSVFKLQEIHEKWDVFKKNQTYLDLGAAPGSWTQWILKNRSPKSVLAIDRSPLTLSDPKLTFKEMDIFELNPEESSPIHSPFTYILSDLAPQTTGIRFKDQEASYQLVSHAFKLALSWLKEKEGGFVFKIFQSEEAETIKKNATPHFKWVRWFKPQATRSQSQEIYLIGNGFQR